MLQGLGINELIVSCATNADFLKRLAFRSIDGPANYIDLCTEQKERLFLIRREGLR